MLKPFSSISVRQPLARAIGPGGDGHALVLAVQVLMCRATAWNTVAAFVLPLGGKVAATLPPYGSTGFSALLGDVKRRQPAHQPVLQQFPPIAAVQIELLRRHRLVRRRAETLLFHGLGAGQEMLLDLLHPPFDGVVDE